MCFTFFNFVSLEQIVISYLKKLFILWLNSTFNYSTWNLIWLVSKDKIVKKKYNCIKGNIIYIG